jgi:hypothetical protein
VRLKSSKCLSWARSRASPSRAGGWTGGNYGSRAWRGAWAPSLNLCRVSEHETLPKGQKRETTDSGHKRFGRFLWPFLHPGKEIVQQKTPQMPRKVKHLDVWTFFLRYRRTTRVETVLGVFEMSRALKRTCSCARICLARRKTSKPSNSWHGHVAPEFWGVSFEATHVAISAFADGDIATAMRSTESWLESRGFEEPVENIVRRSAVEQHVEFISPRGSVC